MKKAKFLVHKQINIQNVSTQTLTAWLDSTRDRYGYWSWLCSEYFTPEKFNDKLKGYKPIRIFDLRMELISRGIEV